ncbi:transposase [Streptomyces paradoxus]|uniref:transposase n=1 Tax=Streptomyces paradoxus TaxID=66375 RepID=UPI00380BAD92
MAAIRVPRRVGRPRIRPLVVLADKAYSSRAIRDHLRRRGVRPWSRNLSARTPTASARAAAAGRPPKFDRDAYKQRNTVERCINRLKQWRGLATRYEASTVYWSMATSV